MNLFNHVAAWLGLDMGEKFCIVGRKGSFYLNENGLQWCIDDVVVIAPNNELWSILYDTENIVYRRERYEPYKEGR